MSVVSFRFFIFTAIVVVLYYVCPRRGRWFILLTGSTLFIIAGSSLSLYLMFALQVLLVYAGARLLSRYSDWAKLICAAVIGLEIAALIVMKESSFFVMNVNFLSRLFGWSLHLEYLSWAAPLAMSYYTLMLVSYVVDVYRKKIAADRNPLRLLLYAGFFPQMMSGPITRYSETAAALWEGHRFDYETFCFGLQRFLWGLFKKLVLSERLAVLVDTIYNGGLEGTWTPTGVYVWVGAIAYTLQLYTEFSGGTDIVLGTAQLLGIELPENFRTPFFSTTMAEVWRRWHITLSFWFRDYIYFPLGGSRVDARWKHIRNLLVVWLCTGFWHGGNYRWIFWGIATFVVLAGGILFKPLFEKLTILLRINTQAESWTVLRQLRTFFLFVIVFSVQPAASLTSALTMWKNAFVFNPWVLMDGSLLRLGLDWREMAILIFGLLLLFVISKYQQKGSVRAMIARQNLVCRWFLWLALFAAVLIFGKYGEGYNPSDFIYGGF
ncbi:MBOAT family protein [Pseudoflavonifractor sp. AF19-9AC]|nr:MBOAT family protein [Pseudoflavonifractor sp. AF19-9AC]